MQGIQWGSASLTFFWKCDKFCVESVSKSIETATLMSFLNYKFYPIEYAAGQF